MYKLLSRQKNEKAGDDHHKTAGISSQVPSEFIEEAMFAAGSFWTVEATFGCIVGVLKTSTGYYGGTLDKPTYREVQNVSDVNTGHTEAVKVVYDKKMASFTSLCEVFWDAHDPTNKEFLQFGLKTHLRSAIFYLNEEQRREAIQSKIRRQMKLNRRIVTVILPGYSSQFFLAETCHQKYHLQRHHIMLCELLNLRSTEHFSDSHVACKLNGILCGESVDIEMRKETLRRFIDGSDISENVKDLLNEILQTWRPS